MRVPFGPCATLSCTAIALTAHMNQPRLLTAYEHSAAHVRPVQVCSGAACPNVSSCRVPMSGQCGATVGAFHHGACGRSEMRTVRNWRCLAHAWKMSTSRDHRWRCSWARVEQWCSDAITWAAVRRAAAAKATRKENAADVCAHRNESKEDLNGEDGARGIARVGVGSHHGRARRPLAPLVDQVVTDKVGRWAGLVEKVGRAPVPA